MNSSNESIRREDRLQQIEMQIEADAPYLRSQGCIITKRARGRRIWVLRYRVHREGKLVHRSIYLGGDEHIELRQRAEELLAWHRHAGLWMEQLPTLVGLSSSFSVLGKRQFSRTASQTRALFSHHRGAQPNV